MHPNSASFAFNTQPSCRHVASRCSESLNGQLEQQIVSLIIEATLDKGQLLNFIDSLRNAVHLTQGPPGTGKSYLGVVLVRALLRIRNLWMQQNPSVGCPPILVLSYKNHAIDEFLCDFLQAEKGSGAR
jgi:DNA replication protein DnaC